MSHPTSAHTPHLDIPRKSTEDPGAHNLESSEDEHFSDASEGKRKSTRPDTPASPIPITRVERVDDTPAHGEVPGTPAYGQRLRDAVPDEIEVVPEGRLSKRSSQILERSHSPGGTPIPRTVVEKVDPADTRYGDDPKSMAWQHRKTDSVPDLVVKAGEGKGSFDQERDQSSSASSNAKIPETVITPVEPNANSNPFSRGSPTRDRPMKRTSIPQTSGHVGIQDENENENDDEDNDFGDDFDNFEEGNQATADDDDDFGDFDSEFQQPDPQPEPEPPSLPPQPLIDFDALSSLPDLLAATQQHLDLLFPLSTESHLSSLSPPPPVSNTSPIFPSDRSRSLWKQLVTPPPLQPPNWTQSRIRRLFLVSLGVPVDLDEILPPSKQKKLVLPDINLEPRRSEDPQLSSLARLKHQANNDSNASLSSNPSQQGTATNAKDKSRPNKKPRGPPPPPHSHLDFSEIRRLCATTDEKIDGFTDLELAEHVKSLEKLVGETSEVLEYWLKTRDGLVKEKEAFEGVIENLVRHVRRVRK